MSGFTPTATKQSIICVAQTRPFGGNIEANINAHQRLIELAISHRVKTIIFPELSLTGYEPELASSLATSINDSRFSIFKELSDKNGIVIGVGIPLKEEAGITISMLIFQPMSPRQVYSKHYLHQDEYPFFVNGKSSIRAIGINSEIALAICYELSIPEHSQDAFERGAKIYIASVAKSREGVEKASNTLSEIAKKYNMLVLMSNSVGPSDNFESAGGTAIWNKEGVLLRQLDGQSEGILMVDTETMEITSQIL